MSNTLMIATVIILLIISFVLYKKIPIQFILIFLPILGALALGLDINKINNLALNFMVQTMRSIGFMMLFGLMYFTMLSKTGMFEQIIEWIMRPFNKKLNNWIIMILTTVISMIAMLTATPTATYLIVFPIMVALYDKVKFDKRVAMIIAQTGISTMLFLPWGQGVATSAIFAGVSPLKLSSSILPISFCFIPVIILQYIFFAWFMKKYPYSEKSVNQNNHSKDKVNVDIYKRPKLFWFNLVIFICVILCLAVLKLPSYLVFAAGAFLTTIIDYPKSTEYKPLWSQSAITIFNITFMIVSIAIFVGIFNGSGMTQSLAKGIVAIFPHFVLRYIHLIILGLSVIIIRFLPYQLFNSFYPILIQIGKEFGLSGIEIVAPFSVTLGLATGSSPLTPATIVGTTLLGVNLDDYCNLAVPIQFVSNILVILNGLIFGVIH